ncbi:unnamed protein product [Parnassius mnemosyne]|uniref:RNA-directed DNA polymerase n=1 Tax=Parnassius mnemosyne TaxID=213953 RepID=A0AAV1LXH1_9NEOP
MGRDRRSRKRTNTGSCPSSSPMSSSSGAERQSRSRYRTDSSTTRRKRLRCSGRSGSRCSLNKCGASRRMQRDRSTSIRVPLERSTSRYTPDLSKDTHRVRSAKKHRSSPINEGVTSCLSANSLIDTFKELVNAIKPDNSSDRYPAINVVPEFDPSKSNQTVNTWIVKVNECAAIYGWSERQIIHYALPKLVGLAQKWYQGLPSLMFSWSEWQDKLRSAFPSNQNYGQLLTEMLACKARFGESLEEYFYEKIVLLNRCLIFGKNATDCILFGIEDRSVRTSAEAAQFTEPDKLLIFLRNVKTVRRPERNTTIQASTSDNRRPKVFKPIQGSSAIKTVPKCYNCGEEGHPYFKCKHTIKRCNTCHKIGHLTDSCPKQGSADSKSVLVITKNTDYDLKYFKSAKVNDIELDCFIDFGSQCTMLKESAAKSLVGSWSTNNLPVLRGFGDSVVRCLGTCEVVIEVDLVKATVQVLIVADELLRVPLLLGQTYTEQDHIVVYKNKDSLKIISRDSQKETKVLLYVAESTSVAFGYNEIYVYSSPNYKGQLFIEASSCQLPKREYEVIQSVIQLNNGQGRVVIKCVSSTLYSLTKDTLLVRALPLKNIQNIYVNKIEYDSAPPVTLIEISMLNIDKDLGHSDKVKLLNLLNEFRQCFAFAINEIGCVQGSEMNIKLNDNNPVVYRPYRLSQPERERVRAMVEELENCGIIRESTSEYASPIILIKKKTGDYRLCIDFRALNKKTVKEHYPLPRIDDQLDNLSGFKYYTSLDLASGYYQVPMSESSKHLTAFITPDGHYEFNRMPFGLANAPSIFQRTINKILGNARFKEAFAYMDDVIIPSKTIEEGFQKLRNTLILFKGVGLTLKVDKCQFFMQNVDYLGFEISKDGVRPGKKKIESVEKFPEPANQHNVRQFLGLARFFRRFIKGFSTIARPLTQLLKKDSKWRWGTEETNAFLSLKEALVKRPVLAFYNQSYETQVHTDASKVGIAGILLQRPNKESPFNAVAYYSRQTTPEESRFTAYDLETLAVVTSLQRFRVYLLGICFTIVTDCNSLRATFEKRDMLPRVARWWNIMQEYDFNIIYRPGLSMSHVDALSRSPVKYDENFVDVCTIDSNWISTVQQSDSELQRIVNILEDPNTSNLLEIKNNFVVKRGLLYRKTQDGDRWVVPKGVQWQVLKANHDDIGHFSVDKTYDRIKGQYWFAKMRRFVKKYVNSCLECAHSKIPAGKKAGELHSIPKVNRPFDTIHIDHLGPFVRSKNKNSYLLLIIDAFTKYIILIPVKSTKTIHSIRAIKHYFHTFSVPRRLISDRGTSFTSKRFNEYLDSLGVKHVLNTVATPRANGQIERYNRTVLASLTASNFGKPEHLWDECVSDIQWGLNNTINKTIGKTPAEALFGIKTIGTNDSLVQINVLSDSDNENAQNTNNIDSIRNEISQRIKIDQTKQKERFDKKRKILKFVVGDLVRVEREIPSTGKSKKLISKVRGPYRICKVLDNDRYVVEDTPISRKGRRFSGIFSVDKIHPWLVYQRNYESDTQSSNSNTDE